MDSIGRTGQFADEENGETIERREENEPNANGDKIDRAYSLTREEIESHEGASILQVGTNVWLLRVDEGHCRIITTAADMRAPPMCACNFVINLPAALVRTEDCRIMIVYESMAARTTDYWSTLHFSPWHVELLKDDQYSIRIAENQSLKMYLIA